MALRAFAREVETQTLVELEDVLRKIMKYIVFLSDHIPLNPMEMKQNSVTFLLYMKMSKILEQNEKLIEEKTSEFQGYLKVSSLQLCM